MRKLIRTIACLMAVATLAVSMAACGGDNATTTAAAAATTVAAAKTTGKQTTTGAATTTIPTTTVIAPVTNPQTGPYAFYQEDEVVEFSGFTMVNNNGYGEQLEDGSIRAESRLTMYTAWDATMKYGKITVDITSAADNTSNDNGVCFGIQGKGMKGILEEDPTANPYFFEKDYAYYICFVSDSGTFGLCKVWWNTRSWTNLQWAGKLDGYTHGDRFTITAEIHEGGVIKCYYNGQLLIEYTDPDPIIGGEGFGFRLEEKNVVCHSIKIEPSEN